jgi:hypothetical protein
LLPLECHSIRLPVPLQSCRPTLQCQVLSCRPSERVSGEGEGGGGGGEGRPACFNVFEDLGERPTGRRMGGKRKQSRRCRWRERQFARQTMRGRLCYGALLRDCSPLSFLSSYHQREERPCSLCGIEDSYPATDLLQGCPSCEGHPSWPDLAYISFTEFEVSTSDYERIRCLVCSGNTGEARIILVAARYRSTFVLRFVHHV